MSATPALLRRILHQRMSRFDVVVQKAQGGRGKGDLIRNLRIHLAYALMKRCDAILVMLDADEDCPMYLARRLAEDALNCDIAVPVAVVCAKAEYEAWIIASLAGEDGDRIGDHLGLAGSMVPPSDVEGLRDAKGWISRRMPRNRVYKPTQDQEKLTHYIAIDLVSRESRSFRRLCHAVEELVYAMDQGEMGMVTPRPF